MYFILPFLLVEIFVVRSFVFGPSYISNVHVLYIKQYIFLELFFFLYVLFFFFFDAVI